MDEPPDTEVVPLLWSALRLLGCASPKYRTAKHLSDAFRRRNTLAMQELLLVLARRAYGSEFQREVWQLCCSRAVPGAPRAQCADAMRIVSIITIAMTMPARSVLSWLDRRCMAYQDLSRQFWLCQNLPHL